MIQAIIFLSDGRAAESEAGRVQLGREGLCGAERKHVLMPKAAFAAIVATALGLGALGIARWLGHPWTHATLIGVGVGCVVLALGLWWASRSAATDDADAPRRA